MKELLLELDELDELDESSRKNKSEACVEITSVVPKNPSDACLISPSSAIILTLSLCR